MEKVNVVFATNNDYAPFLIVALKSLLEHISIKNFYCIYIFETDVSDTNKDIIDRMVKSYSNVEIVYCNTAKIFEENKFFHYTYYSQETYARLFVPDILDCDKALYLDCDIIVLADVAELYNIEIGNNLIAGVKNFGLIAGYTFNPKLQEYYDKMYITKNLDEFVNAGIIVMNLKELRKLNLAQTGLAILNHYKHLLNQDEDILNRVCAGRILHVESGWNWRYVVPEQLIYDYRLIKLAQEWAKGLYNHYIIHYVSKIKPWDEPNMFYGDIWWSWAKKTEIYQDLLNRYFTAHPEKLAK